MLSEPRLKEAREALEAARDYQAEFWRALSDLEAILGVDVSGTIDLEQYSVEDLMDLAEAGEET
jgi:intein-encoded DNA endonuclease-like protein